MAAGGDRIDLGGLSRAELEALVVELAGPRFHGLQIFKWIHQRGVRDIAAMSDLSKELRRKLSERAFVGGLTLAEVRGSPDGTRKLVLETHDGLRVESVLIPDTDRRAPAAAAGAVRRKLTLCLSTQVGCPLDCAFCHTGTLGLARGLAASEICDQLPQALAILGPDEALTNLVLMGMGEPLLNYEATVAALNAFVDPAGQAFGTRRITLSTVGIPERLDRLARDSRVNIAVSLNAATDELRSRLMPRANARWPLAEVLEALRRFPVPAGRRLTFEVVLIAGVNDGADHARQVAELVRPFRAKVNLIPFNPIPSSPWRRPSDEQVGRFQAILLGHDVSTSVRQSRGVDVAAACGMLGGTKG